MLLVRRRELQNGTIRLVADRRKGDLNQVLVSLGLVLHVSGFYRATRIIIIIIIIINEYYYSGI